MQVVIEIDEERFQDIQRISTVQLKSNYFKTTEQIIAEGIPLPKGHGRLIDISKIDEDRIDHDNPIIYLIINGEYTEAISLDYLNSLPTIIEADRTESEE